MVEILILAFISGLIFFHLWNILGRRTGSERKNESYNRIFEPPSHEEKEEPKFESFSFKSAPSPLVQPLLEKDPNFSEREFLRGAEKAFELIVKAYSEGKKEFLEKLLSPSLYEQFCQGIDQREVSESVEILEIDSEIEKVDFLPEEKAQITVLFKSSQKKGETEPFWIFDRWTFERPLNAVDPLWILVKTTNVD